MNPGTYPALLALCMFLFCAWAVYQIWKEL